MAKKKTKRRIRGTGSRFFHKGRGLWIGRKVVGRKPNGKPLYVERSAATVAELEKALDQVGPPGPGTTLSQWLDRWLSEMVCRSRTRDIRETDARLYLKPVLGHLRVAELTPLQIEQAAAVWAGGLAATTVRQCLSVLRTAYTAARRAGLVAVNPVSLVRLPRTGRKKIDTFNPAQLAAIIREAHARPSTLAVALIAATGCRVGEAVALDAGEYDSRTGLVSISRSWDPKHGPGPPKTVNGVRVIEVHPVARDAVAQSQGGRDEGPLFCTRSGARTTRLLIRVAWMKLLARLELPYRRLHELRHSVATEMIASGFPLADVAKYLGDSVETVVRTYLHATGQNPRTALDSMFGNGNRVGAKRSDHTINKKTQVFRRA